MLQRDRKFELILYPDSESYDCESVIEQAKVYFEEYAYILHDSDLNEDGTPKKLHYHFIGRFENPRSPDNVCLELGVDLSSLANIRKWKSALRYLVHLDHPKKYQYSPSVVVSNLNYISLLGSSSDDVQAKMILDFIFSCRSPPLVSTVLSWSLENGCYSAFRRGFAVFSQVLREMSIYNKEI